MRGTGFGWNAEVLVNFYAPVSTNPLHHLVKKEHIWPWGAKQQAAFEKANILVKQIKALRISRWGCHLCFRNPGWHGLDIIAKTTKGVSAPGVLVPNVRRGRDQMNIRCTPIEQHLLVGVLRFCR